VASPPSTKPFLFRPLLAWSSSLVPRTITHILGARSLVPPTDPLLRLIAVAFFVSAVHLQITNDDPEKQGNNPNCHHRHPFKPGPRAHVAPPMELLQWKPTRQPNRPWIRNAQALFPGSRRPRSPLEYMRASRPSILAKNDATKLWCDQTYPISEKYPPQFQKR